MSIDKKINYEDQRLTEKQKKKIKPVNQGGGPNYLGKQETVTVPKKWLSDPDHVVAELAYITPREKKILLEKNLYGSLKGKPNRGPGGVQSLQGDMGSVGGGPSSSGGDGRDKGMGMAGKTGDYSSGPTGNDGGTNKFSGFTKNVLNPNIDFIGNTVFGPTQKYSGDGFLSGYRNIDPVTGQPLMGASYVADRFKSVFSPSNIIGGILGLINPALGLGFKAVNYLKDEIPETFNQFKDSATLEEFRDKVRGYGRTMPTVSPNPMYGGIESLAVNPQITNDLLAFNPGSVKDRALKQQYGIYNATGMMNPNMIDLMKQDIELNKQKGTPLSLPAEAYSLIG